jgi:hypothetical protein
MTSADTDLRESDSFYATLRCSIVEASQLSVLFHRPKYFDDWRVDDPNGHQLADLSDDRSALSHHF